MNGHLLASIVIVVGLVAASYVYLADAPISGNVVKAKQQTISQALEEAKSFGSNIPSLPSFSPTQATTKITPNITTSPSISQNVAVKTQNNTKMQAPATPTTTQFNQIQTPCSEEWSCSDWSVCQNSQQTRNCTDSNNCGTTENKLTESQICSQSTPTQASQPKIVNIKFDADGDDKMKANWNTEWIEINGQGIDMSGWILSDSANHTFVFSEVFVINGTIKIHSGNGENTQTDLYWNGGKRPIWNNDGDTAFLKDKNGNLVDQYDYGG